MDPQTPGYFAQIVALANTTFGQVESVTDMTPQRAILRVQAMYGPYQVLITELWSKNERKYRYYVLHDDRIEAGFDNSPDPRAIRLKYGRKKSGHAGEAVPHLHLDDKTRLSLTEEMNVESFILWLKSHLPLAP